MTESAAHVRVIEETSAYWRVLFENPPFNIVDATIFECLQDLLARMDTSPSLRVVVFESANPGFYLVHFHLTGKIGNIMTAVEAYAPPVLTDSFVRLTRSPRAPDCLLRPACHRGSEGSRQPGLAAPNRSAPGRIHFVWSSAEVARSPAPHRRRAGAWTAA